MARGKWRGGQRTRVRGVKCLGSGLYRIRVTIQDPLSGKRKERERIVEASDVRAAAAIRAEMEQKLRGSAGSPGWSAPKPAAPAKTRAEASPRSLRVADWARAWLAKVIGRKRRDGSPRVTPNTKDRYVSGVERIIVPSIGKLEVDSISRDIIEAWRDWLGEKYAAQTVNGWLSILRTILRDGGSNVADKVPGLRVDDTRVTDDEPNLLEDEAAVLRFLEAVKQREPEHLPLIGLLLTTGLRVSTALALRREDFDPKDGVIVARRRLSGGEVIEGIKRSRTARDVVPLVDWVWRAMEAEWAGHNEAQRKSGLAFPTRSGGHRARTLLKKPMENVAKALGLGRLTPHGLRRTAALLYRRRSGSAVSKAIAGHLTEEMHLHYAPVLAAERAQAGRDVFGSLDVGTGVRGDVGTDVGSMWGRPWGRGSEEGPGSG